MVITRSQSRLQSRLQSDVIPVPAAPRFQYRGFSISSLKHMSIVDKFQANLELGLKHSSVLTKFWIKHSPKMNLPELPFESREKLLFSLVENDALWEKFNKVIEQNVVQSEQYLELPEFQDRINAGETLLLFDGSDGSQCSIDLTPLLEFSFWIKQMCTLMCSVMSELLQKVVQTDGKSNKALIVKHIFQNNLICRKLITSEFIFSGVRYYSTQLAKMIEMFKEGLEFALYGFGVFHPEMMSDKCYPLMNKSSDLYGLPMLAVSDDDPVFGEAKKAYQRFY